MHKSLVKPCDSSHRDIAQIKNEASNLLSQTLSLIKETKSSFVRIISLINERGLGNQLTSEMKHHLKALNELWKKIMMLTLNIILNERPSSLYKWGE